MRWFVLGAVLLFAIVWAETHFLGKVLPEWILAIVIVLSSLAIMAVLLILMILSWADTDRKHE